MPVKPQIKLFLANSDKADNTVDSKSVAVLCSTKNTFVVGDFVFPVPYFFLAAKIHLIPTENLGLLLA